MRRVLTAALVFAMAAPAAAGTQLTGAGSSFVYPFFSKAFFDYSKSHGDVTINYQSIGSGAGIQQFTAKTIDFGASDVPMNADELKKANEAVIQIPVALGGVAVVYNLPGIHKGLRITRELLADMFLGKVTNWNDPEIAKLNKGVALPNLPVIVVHRSDGSGTTYITTDFLSRVSSEWKTKVGVGKSVSWPAASSVGGKGNEGVAGQVNNAPGAIGYVELAYALANHMDSAAIQNAAGQFINCSAETVSVAAATKPGVNAGDYSITNAKAKRAYPIAGYTWVMVYKNMSDKAKAKTLHDALEWVVSGDAQKIAGGLNYAPLPANVQATAKASLKQMQL